MPIGFACASLTLFLTQADVRGEGRGGLAPDRVLTGFSQDPTGSFSVTWRTRGSRGPHRLEVKGWGGENLRFDAATKVLENRGFDVGQVHSATAKGLKSGSTLHYRVVSGAFSSPWFPLRTASEEADPFEFVVFGDAQSRIKAASTPLFEAALARSPQARLALHCGDLIDDNTSAREWGEWHYAMKTLGPAIPSLATPGNHEYGIYGRSKNRSLNALWRPGFALPENGPPGLEETCYWLDYQGVRFISLDSLKPLEPQLEWVAKLPVNRKVSWTVVFKHYPVFPSLKGQEAPGRTRLLTKAFERLGVDLVFTGHLHSYARSGLVKGGDFRSKQGGVVYAISVTGGKFYGQDRFPWMSVAFPRTATYHVVSASPEALRVKAFDLAGKIRDDFELTQGTDGQNLLTEHLR